MGMRFGEKDARPVDEIRRATDAEKEFLLAGNPGEEIENENSEPIRRKRGRPRKHPLIEFNKDGEPVRRKRGRPRKYPRKGETDGEPTTGKTTDETDDNQKPKRNRPPKDVNRLSDFQIDAATDRVILGERIADVAADLGVGVNPLAKKIKTRCGMLYLRKWQQSVQFDCLRAEFMLKASLRNVVETDDPRWVANGLKILEYRAKVLGFAAVSPIDQTLRVAGMNQDEVFDKILEKL